MVPLGNIWGPLIVWLVKRDESPGVDAHGKESLNFQINALVWTTVFYLLIIVIIGVPLIIAYFVFYLVCVIIATVRASQGGEFRYPLTIRLIT